MVSVRATGPGDWELVRDVRLAALRDAPDAFASTYEREAAYTEEQWRGWFSDRFAMFLAHLEDRAEPAGLAGVFDRDDGAGLVSMWVRPDARGRGVGEALMNAAAGWAKDRGHDAMYLWVAEANERGPAAVRALRVHPDRRPPAAAVQPRRAGNPDAPAALSVPDRRVGNPLFIRWSPSPAPGTVKPVCLNR